MKYALVSFLFLSLALAFIFFACVSVGDENDD